MNGNVFTIKDIVSLVKPIAKKYGVKEIYLFGSYARGEADEDSDLDFVVFGGENFKLTMIFAFAEELREVLKKDVDVFEINEINKDSDFYNTIMKERLLVAWGIQINSASKRYMNILQIIIAKLQKIDMNKYSYPVWNAGSGGYLW